MRLPTSRHDKERSSGDGMDLFKERLSLFFLNTSVEYAYNYLKLDHIDHMYSKFYDSAAL